MQTRRSCHPHNYCRIGRGTVVSRGAVKTAADSHFADLLGFRDGSDDDDVAFSRSLVIKSAEIFSTAFNPIPLPTIPLTCTAVSYILVLSPEATPKIFTFFYRLLRAWTITPWVNM
ncbi:hypothetical protein SISSUDRAFT_1054908 [Sistotremastrum suecicum HHB10207 ss-3]|uniref:Uncharacterized protein n=1 Tax=Sistotremastrum suecicum HHB10207 ss-3 TaxID=1314776 RepID=A0A165Y5U0_9AGAM|nr:hypothetical protein SISSUDRAFT_1054908 [Sistotremastrum suecicum HHB10207 ss-3]